MTGDVCYDTIYPSIEYQWIGHCWDHFTKFHFLWPQTKKSAKEVVYNIRRHVLGYIGLPEILHSDNGLEFKNQYVRDELLEWVGKIEMRHGRARNPQCQGGVEQGNFTVASKDIFYNLYI